MDPDHSKLADARFPQTRWSIVLEAQAGQPQQARAAMEDLCHLYWHPVYAYVRRCGQSPEDAEDLTQGFFARLIERDSLALAAQEKGKLRSFLLTVLKRFMADEWRRSHAEKRGGGVKPVSIDQSEAEERYASIPVTSESPDLLFDRRWALSLLERIFTELRSEFVTAGKAELFDALSPALAWNSGGGSYRDLAARTGMSESALRVAVYRLRRRYGALMRRLVEDTVPTSEDADDEMQFLLSAVRRPA